MKKKAPTNKDDRSTQGLIQPPYFKRPSVTGFLQGIIGRLQVYKVCASIPPQDGRRFSRNAAPIPPQKHVHSAAQGDNSAARSVEESVGIARAAQGENTAAKGDHSAAGCRERKGDNTAAGGQYRRSPTKDHAGSPERESIPPQARVCDSDGSRGIAWAPWARG
jgi:hypothetical protein